MEDACLHGEPCVLTELIIALENHASTDLLTPVVAEESEGYPPEETGARTPATKSGRALICK